MGCLALNCLDDVGVDSLVADADGSLVLIDVVVVSSLSFAGFCLCLGLSNWTIMGLFVVVVLDEGFLEKSISKVGLPGSPVIFLNGS